MWALSRLGGLTRAWARSNQAATLHSDDAVHDEAEALKPTQISERLVIRARDSTDFMNIQYSCLEENQERTKLN